MKVLTFRVDDDFEKMIRLKAKLGHRTISEQIKKSIYENFICENNPDLPLQFIRDTLEAQAEMEAGFFEEYKFGVLE